MSERIFEKGMKVDLREKYKGHYVPEGFFKAYTFNGGQMKIQDIKGIVDRLPKLNPQFLVSGKVKQQIDFCRGRCEMHEEVLSTDLPDPNEVVEIDVEKTIAFLANIVPFYADPDIKEIRKMAQAIAESGCLRWKEER